MEMEELMRSRKGGYFVDESCVSERGDEGAAEIDRSVNEQTARELRGKSLRERGKGRVRRAGRRTARGTS